MVLEVKRPRWIELIGWGLLAVYFAGLALFVGMSLLSEEDPPIWLKLALIYLVVAWLLYSTFWTDSVENTWERSSKTTDKKQEVFLSKLIVVIVCIASIWFSIPMLIELFG